MKPKEYYEEKIRAYQHRLAAELERARREGATLQDEARREFEEKIAELQAMRDDANRRARTLMEAGHESWRDLERGLAQAYDTVFEATRNAMRRFGLPSEEERESRERDSRAEQRRRQAGR